MANKLHCEFYSEKNYVYVRSDINDHNYTYVGYCRTPLQAKKMCQELADVFEGRAKIVKINK